jgi:hypothetical protein
MHNIIYLYLKTHNVTGLKYLGKTIRDPFEYKGSGLIWNSHLKKHGYDVTTEILFQTTSKSEFKRVALEYSNKLNIVESKEFANLTLEEGQGGKTWINHNHSAESKEKIAESRRGKRGELSPRSKRCSIHGIIYESVRIAADELNIHHTTISYRCRSKNPEYFYLAPA